MNAIPEMTGQPMLILWIEEGDELLHTDDHLVCDDPTCPCRDEIEDCASDELPTENEIEAMYTDHTRWLNEHL